MGACQNSSLCVFVLFLAGFLFESSFFSKSRLCTWPLFSHFVRNLDQLAGQPILWNSSMGLILWEIIVWIYNLTVTIVSQKYQELSLQVEISEQLYYSFNARWKKNYRFFSKTLFYSISLSQPLLTHGRNDRQRNKYTCCTWAGGTESQFGVERKLICELHNTSLKFNIRVEIL